MARKSLIRTPTLAHTVFFSEMTSIMNLTLRSDNLYIQAEGAYIVLENAIYKAFGGSIIFYNANLLLMSGVYGNVF